MCPSGAFSVTLPRYFGSLKLPKTRYVQSNGQTSKTSAVTNLLLTYPSSRVSGDKNILTTNKPNFWRSPTTFRLHERHRLNLNQLDLLTRVVHL